MLDEILVPEKTVWLLHLLLVHQNAPIRKEIFLLEADSTEHEVHLQIPQMWTIL